jgi:hypothetical protein
MKYFFTTVLLTVFCLFAFAQSWKSATYKVEPYRKIVVMAKTTDELAKRQIEDATVTALAEKGITAIPAYNNLKPADIATEAALIAKADELEVDALLTYTVVGKESKIKNKASVNASVGVPIKLGIFRGAIGGNVPLAGGAKTESIIVINAGFYNRSSSSLQWSFGVEGTQKNGTQKLANTFAKKTVAAMVKDKLFFAQ